MEKKRSKGGFLQLFDWPGKSRKKLFANSSEPTDETKKRKSDDCQFSKSRPHIMGRDDTRTNSSNNARSDFSCVSSVASDEEHGNRPPSVVARLMGLDSLPVPTVQGFQSNPILDSIMLESSRPYEHSDYICFPNNLEGVSWNHVDARMSRPQNRPFERFQTEMLPPKSAKSIPITHNRLLSPIRGPGFVPTNNPAYIMEAASRIIETSPRVVTNRRVSTIGSSSVPLRVRDFKEKLEAAHKSSVGGTSKYSLEGQTEKRHTSSSKGTSVATISGKGSSDRSNIKEKSYLPAAQAKTNLQKRDSSTSSSYSRDSLFRKEKPESKNRGSKNHSDAQRSFRRATSANTPKTVLRQNNQKQNCKDTSSSNPSAPYQQGKRVANKVVNKVVVESERGSGYGSKRMGLSVIVKDVSVSKKRIVIRNKKSPDEYPEKRVCYDMIKRDEGSIRCNVAVDGDTSLNQKKGNDVISFSFSCPIKGYGCEPRSSSLTGREIHSSISSSRASSTHTASFISAGDSPRGLFEQDLNCKSESSGYGVIQEESSESSYMDSSPSINRPCQSGFISFDGKPHDLNQSFQIVRSNVAEEPIISGTSSNAYKEFNYLEPSPTSNLFPSCSESCSDISDSINGIKQLSLYAQDSQNFNWLSSSNESCATEEDNGEFSESASSLSMATVSCIKSTEPNNWELQYINSILKNSQLMLEPFMLGNTQDISFTLYEQLEDCGDPVASNIERKALFDCVIQCLKRKQEQYLTGRFNRWAKDTVLFERKDWLAEELYKEISGWKNMGDLMVDELVDKDMSSLSGKWIDFENEAFEEGVEVVRLMVSALVDDLICDLVVF